MLDLDDGVDFAEDDADRGFGPGDELLDEHTLVVFERGRDREFPFGGVAHERQPERGAFRIRLHDQRKRHPGGDLHLGVVDQRVGGVADARLVHHALGLELVHHDAAGFGGTADERDPGLFHHRLDRAVLAESAVKHGVDDVRGAHAIGDLRLRDVVRGDVVARVAERLGDVRRGLKRDFTFGAGPAHEDEDVEGFLLTHGRRLFFHVDRFDLGLKDDVGMPENRAAHGADEFVAVMAGMRQELGRRRGVAHDPVRVDRGHHERAAALALHPGGFQQTARVEFGRGIAEDRAGAAPLGRLAAAFVLRVHGGFFRRRIDRTEPEPGRHDHDVLRDAGVAVAPEIGVLRDDGHGRGLEVEQRHVQQEI